MPDNFESATATFTQLDDVRKRLMRLRRTMAASLAEFAQMKEIAGAPFTFAHTKKKLARKRKEGARSSVGSTSTCLTCIADHRAWDDTDLENGAAKVASQKVLGQMLVSLVDKHNWTGEEGLKLPPNNPFDISFALEGAANLLAAITNDGSKALDRLDLAANVQENIVKEIKIAARELVKNIKSKDKSQGAARGAANIPPHPPTAFLTQLAVRGLLALDVLRKTSPDNDGFPNKGDVKSCLRLAREWCLDHARKHLVKLQTGSPNGDFFELLHATLVFATIDAKGTLITAESLRDPDERRLAEAALKEFLAHQNPDGSWPWGRPLFHYNEIGDAHCYAFESLAQVLKCRPLWPLLRIHHAVFTKALDYAEAMALPGEGADHAIKQWSSGHTPGDFKPESWSTASVYEFGHQYQRFLAEEIRRSNFQEFQSALPESGRKKDTDIQEIDKELLDSEIPAAEGAEPYSFRDVLKKGIIQPLRDETDAVHAGATFKGRVPVSILLFGPPGTSKTQTASLIADYIGWPLLTIDPSHFVRHGLDNVQAEATQIFQRLAAMEEVVVLLDEVDELVRQRDDKESPESRFLTTAMLPKLIEINKLRRIVFIVATNHIEHFDLAVSREGRFDTVLQVMPPSLKEKTNPGSVAMQHDRRENMRALAKTLRDLHVGMDGNMEHIGCVVEAMTYSEYNRFSHEFDWKKTPPGKEELEKSIMGLAPKLTMFQLREWHLPDAYSHPYDAPKTLARPRMHQHETPSAEGTAGILPPAMINGHAGDEGKGYRPWHWVYRLSFIANKNRLPRPYTEPLPPGAPE